MRRMYPQAGYGETPVFQLLYNLKNFSGWVPFVLFMVPFGWTALILLRRRSPVNAAGAGLFAGAVIFLGMWLVAGRIKEVRIFLPFALALAPLTAELMMQRFLPGRVEDVAEGPGFP
jgi:hypothetical protein